MGRATRWAAIGFVGLCAAAAGAPPGPVPAAPAARPNVPRLIADLGSDDYRVREAAGRDLARVGIAAVPAMRAVQFTTDRVDVQRRIAVLARNIETAHLEAPTRITLAARQQTVNQVCAEITRQAGCTVEYDGPVGADAPRYDFDFENVPLFQAVDRVAEATGTGVETGSDSITVTDGGVPDECVAYAGPFKFVAQHVQVVADLALAAPRGRPAPRDENIRVQYMMVSEPKNPIFDAGPSMVVSAEDDRGRPLVAPVGRTNLRQHHKHRGRYAHRFHGVINLRPAAAGGAAARSIKSLKARIAVEMLAGVKPEIEVADPLGADGRTFTGRTVAAKVVRLVQGESKPGYVLDVTFTRLGAGRASRQDRDWAYLLSKRVELQDEAGNAYHTDKPTHINNNPGSVSLTIPFTNRDPRTGERLRVGPPAKLVVYEWLRETREVTFEFRDVPLP